ncbi:3-hydroxyacyl-CoA dehydrogenase NAD-binding domain-containing protein [Thauera linaloolentis]|uniref:Enoyl-CoA hydratase/3-hydroxyacyl-CoA dehydrogenase n=1 Tax=Thauera linaloolentis (strain DSM 12138 / JCM 21573 / CCUG 41526 / CIP 105981 / IAM 15112 / NBRC 102519 / 47Lol) TaxID=1123367 RepID=N6YZ07_THAL4|nr:3-hydroxyacyl-CoA dehydrogenase NAD-binding domain-containing protein [Thauera linaloolentis]ENO87353.1 Enoyl-CoA hydratase/3-hydroxyacyl-CoA dehydrogenase [Thauera linaloolentis 47Lol = DSM 12138]MCM8565467.1 3-hydroxyacyl-CoA dehydrogenase NAD-binding domain-containing protein [Thauera linaloolentis]
MRGLDDTEAPRSAQAGVPERGETMNDKAIVDEEGKRMRDAMNDSVTLERAGRIGLIRIDHPPVNALAGPVRTGLRTAVDRLAAEAVPGGTAAGGLAAVVVYAAGRTFVAGGDIAEFDDPDYDITHLLDTLARLEGLALPVVAALHGSVLGGGLEIAMACHYRVAQAGTRLGQPEVRLGLLPGAGGTQRLPRLVGAGRALEMMLDGQPIGTDEALRLGLIDAVTDGDPRTAALAYAENLLAQGAGPRRSAERPVMVTAGAGAGNEAAAAATEVADFFARRRTALAARAAVYPALPRIVDAVEAGCTQGFAAGLAVETQAFQACLRAPQSQAMRALFFAEREAAKLPGLPADVALRPIRRVGVVGAGTMGGGIAMNFANAGIPVVLVDTSAEALARGLDIVRRNYQASAARGKLDVAEVERRMACLHGTLALADLGDCDLVIEAVFENMALKLQVCAQLGEVCRPGAIIATNTSTLDMDALARASGRAGDFVGMHFFSPANVMRLLEVVRGAHTAPEVLATVVRLARTIGKVAVVSGVCYGFIGNRMLESYLRESEFLLLEGASPARIDAAIQSLGLPMGPCRMLDMAGLDVAAKVVIEHLKAGGLPPDPSYRAAVQRMFALGRFGQKTGAGYYRYDGRTPLPDPEVADICRALAAEHGIAQRDDIGDDEIIERCLYPLINEGARILEEGIAYRPGDIDVVWTCGYGFPDHRGGPMHMADRLGAAHIVRRLEHYARQRGNPHGYWDRSALLARLAEHGGRLADFRGA